MGQSIKKNLQKGYNQLKKVMKKILTPGREREFPSLVVQPIRRQPPGFQKENNTGDHSR